MKWTSNRLTEKNSLQQKYFRVVGAENYNKKSRPNEHQPLDLHL